MPSTRSKRKQQTQLGFTPLPDSSPAKSSQPLATRSRAAAVTISDSKRPAKRAKVTDSFLPTPEASSQPHALEDVGGHKDHQKSSSNVQKPASPASRHTRSFTRNGKVATSTNTRAARHPSKSSKTTVKGHLESFNDSESESEVGTPPRSTRNAKRGSYKATKSSQKQTIEIASSEEESEPGIGVSPLKKRNRIPAITTESESGSDEDAPAPSRRRQPSSATTNDEDEDSDAPITPSKTRVLSRQAQQDLQDDLEDLRSSSPPPAFKPTVESSARKAALDALRKKRGKQSKRGNGTSRAPRVISDDEDDPSGEEEEVIEYADAEQQEEGYYDDDENDNFVEDDDDEDLPGGSALPLEFRLQKEKPSVLFPYVVEWMVHKRLNPGFNMGDPVYELAFRKLNDFAHGMGSSKFTSSAWNGTFLRALKARPQLEETHFTNDGLQHDKCDACNRSGHPATFEMQFKGAPYHAETLEDMSDDEDEDVTREADLPAEEHTFYIGKWCARNARVAHALAHWQRHLFDWVVDWLEHEGFLSQQAILKRDKMTTKKRGEIANAAVDRMKAEGEIKSLHHAFKAEIEAAQEQHQYTRFTSP